MSFLFEMFAPTPYERAVTVVKNKQADVDKTQKRLVILKADSVEADKKVEPVEPVEAKRNAAKALDDAAQADFNVATNAAASAQVALDNATAASRIAGAPASTATALKAALRARDVANANLKTAKDKAATVNKVYIFENGRVASVIASNSDAIDKRNDVASVQIIHNANVVALKAAQDALAKTPATFTNQNTSCYWNWLFYVIAALICIAMVSLVVKVVRNGSASAAISPKSLPKFSAKVNSRA